jgi:hypothetical protein
MKITFARSSANHNAPSTSIREHIKNLFEAKYNVTRKIHVQDAPFCAKVAFANTCGYLLATIPPIVIDPRLIHHLRYGARHYAIGWWIVPIGVIAGIATFFALAQANGKTRTRWNSIPLLIVATGSLPAFRPEFPHANIVSVSILSIVLSTIATWIRYQPLHIEFAQDARILEPVPIESVKEQVSFWRGVLLTMSAVLLAAIIMWFNSMTTSNRQYDVEPNELMLLTNLSLFITYFGVIWFLFGPLAEAYKKYKRVSELLCKCKKS